MELEQFDRFWEIVDNLLNSILYVMLGLMFFIIIKMPHVLLISLVAIVANFLGAQAVSEWLRCLWVK